jgi:hypothetical protein
MRRWLCCTCQVEESYPSNENEHLKSPRSFGEGEFLNLIYGRNLFTRERSKNKP